MTGEEWRNRGTSPDPAGAKVGCIRVGRRNFHEAIAAAQERQALEIDERRSHCPKLLGQSLMARDVERQVAEFQIRIAVPNRYTDLGIPVTEPIGQSRPG